MHHYVCIHIKKKIDDLEKNKNNFHSRCCTFQRRRNENRWSIHYNLRRYLITFVSKKLVHTGDERLLLPVAVSLVDETLLSRLGVDRKSDPPPPPKPPPTDEPTEFDFASNLWGDDMFRSAEQLSDERAPGLYRPESIVPRRRDDRLPSLSIDSSTDGGSDNCSDNRFTTALRLDDADSNFTFGECALCTDCNWSSWGR